MKNKNRIQILLKILSKSDKILDDIGQITIQVFPISPGLFKRVDEKDLFAPHDQTISTKDISDYRNLLIEQLKEANPNCLKLSKNRKD